MNDSVTARGILRVGLLVLFVSAAIVVDPTPADAQGPCSGVSVLANDSYAAVVGFANSAHTGCTMGMAYGQAIACQALTSITFPFNVFQADWPSPAARTGDSTGGCVFMCTSGDCRVGNDGLPVELLGFDVE